MHTSQYKFPKCQGEPRRLPGGYYVVQLGGVAHPLRKFKKHWLEYIFLCVSFYYQTSNLNKFNQICLVPRAVEVGLKNLSF